jgi:hypothetical protein
MTHNVFKIEISKRIHLYAKNWLVFIFMRPHCLIAAIAFLYSALESFVAS